VSALKIIKGPTGEVPGPGASATEKVKSAVADCMPGERAVSGGGSSGIAGLIDSEMEPSHLSWFIVVDNNTSIVVKIHASVECAAEGQAVAARLPRAGHPLMNKRLAEARAEAQADGSAGASK
jgi:hypothetical protein